MNSANATEVQMTENIESHIQEHYEGDIEMVDEGK